MKKLFKILLSAILMIVILSVGVTAFASSDDSVQTYEKPYIGDYDATDGSGHTGFAHIVFGKVSNVGAECGILLTNKDEGWTRKYPVKTDSDGTKRITSSGEFGIAIYDLPDGEYTVCAYSGSENQRILGESYTLRAGVSEYTVTYVYDGEAISEAVSVGGIPRAIVDFEKEGYKIAGYKTADDVVFDMTKPVYDDVTLYPIWTPDKTARVTLAGNPSYLTHEVAPKAGETVKLEFDVVEILAFSTIGSQARFGFGLMNGANVNSGFASSVTGNVRLGTGTVVGGYTLKSDYIGETTTLSNIPTFKAGERVKVEYKPFVSETEKGYIKTYVKQQGASDNTYTLVGGVENINSTDGTLALFADNGTVLDMIVANMSFSTDSGDLGIKNVAYSYESGELFTKISNTVTDNDISYEITTMTAGNVVVGSKTRLDMTYGDVYEMEFHIDYSNFGDYEAGVVNMQTGNVGIGVTSHDTVGWPNSPILNPSALFVWYNGTGWGSAVRIKDASGVEYTDTSGAYIFTKPSPNSFSELYKTGNQVRVEYTPYFSAEETGDIEQLGSYVIYVKKANASSFSVWASVTGLPASLAPRDNIGMFIFSTERGNNGRKLEISDFTTRIGERYVYSASGNPLGLSATTMLGGDYYAHSLSIDKTSLNMLVGTEAIINATVEPEDDLVWTSSNESVATVEDGKVTAISNGTAIITVTTPGGNSAQCSVTVNDGLNVSFTLGGEEYHSESVNASSGFKLTSLPVVDDITTDASSIYYFGGWYTDSSCTTLVSLDTVYSQDTVIYGDYRCAYLYDAVGNNAVIRGVIDEISAIGELEIPSTIDGKSVTEIGNEAFLCSSLIQVTIPSSVTKIGNGAFRESYDLSKVTIEGSGLTTIGNSAFRDCEAITTTTSLVIPTSVTSVGELAFYGANHPKYGGMYILNYQDIQYYTPKYVYEFLGEDVMPIATYGAFTAKGETGVADPTYGVGLETAVEDFVGAGLNLMEVNSYANMAQIWGESNPYSIGSYLRHFENNGAMMLYMDSSMRQHLYSEYATGGNATFNAYEQYLYNKYASFGGVLSADEPGWVDWIDEYEDEYTFYQRTGSSASSALATDSNGNYIEVTKKKGRMDDGHRAWREAYPNKLMFVNLLQTYAPKWALPNGYFGYNDGGQLDGIPNLADYPSLTGELDYEYYYRTYIESVKPQVLSYDYYPLAGSGTNLYNTHFEQLNYANYYAGEYYKNYHDTTTGIPFWPMIQLSGWNGFRPNVGANLAEVNWQINTALAYGAKGYSYFGYVQGSASSAGYAIDQYGNKTDSYYIVQTANDYTQSMAKWLLNAEVDHLTQVGANPNCYDVTTKTTTTPEATPTRMLTPKDTTMNWRLNSSSGVAHIVSHMKYYANNNDYRNDVAGDVRELYFVCNNSITNGGNVTLNFGSAVTGSYVYQGVEYSFSGTSLTINVPAGQAFAILLD